MIMLDTHMWIWWVHADNNLSQKHFDLIQEQEKSGLGVSIISCWEVAKLAEYNRLSLPCTTSEWFEEALNYPGITLVDLTPRIVIESTQLPDRFHRDPADQLIVATARIHNLPLLTADSKIVEYTHVKTL